MKKVSVGELKNRLSEILISVEQGEEIQVCRRNVPIALIVPYGTKKRKNKTVLGCGLGTVRICGDLTEPMIQNL